MTDCSDQVQQSAKCIDQSHFTWLAPFLSVPLLLLPAPPSPKHPLKLYTIPQSAIPSHILNPYVPLVSPSYQSQSPDGPLQCCACSFIRAHQFLSGDFWSLPLSPLSLVYQVLCLLFITYPFSYYPACTEKITDWIALMSQMLSPSTYHYSHHNIRVMYILQKVKCALLCSEAIELCQRWYWLVIPFHPLAAVICW